MTRRISWVAAALAVVVNGGALLVAQNQAPTIILTGGKVITLHDRFTSAQAVAIRGDRIVAVGTNQEISRMAGPGTRTIDLRGRSVMPGLIDNHMHVLRAGTTWK